MKKAGKYILYFVGLVIILSILYIGIGLLQDKSMDEINREGATLGYEKGTAIETVAETDADKLSDWFEISI